MYALFETAGANLNERMSTRTIYSSSLGLYLVCFTLNKRGLEPVSKHGDFLRMLKGGQLSYIKNEPSLTKLCGPTCFVGVIIMFMLIYILVIIFAIIWIGNV